MRHMLNDRVGRKGAERTVRNCATTIMRDHAYAQGALVRRSQRGRVRKPRQNQPRKSGGGALYRASVRKRRSGKRETSDHA